jgi:MFS family permease
MYAAQESFNFNGQSIVNTDFFPSAMLYYAAYKSENENSMAYSLLNWISMQTPENLLIIALLLLTAPLIVRIRVFHPANYSAKPSAGYICFLSGMCGFSCVSIVIYMYQIKIGSLYGDIGLISAANFCGYALAAIVTNRLKRSNGRTLVFIFLCIQSLLIPVVLSGTITIFTEKWMFFLLMLILGALNGSVYPFLIRCAPAAHYGRTQKWIKMYVCELFGAAAGAVVIGLLLLSTMGLINIVILILAALTVSILQIFGWQKDKRKYVGINTDGQE